MSDTPESVGEEINRRLADFTEKLEAGVPIEATKIVRHQTPDGPMHVRVPTAINTSPPEE